MNDFACNIERMIFHEKSCDRLCLLDFNEWNCIIFLYGTIKLIINYYELLLLLLLLLLLILMIMIWTLSPLYQNPFASGMKALLPYRPPHTLFPWSYGQ